MASSTKNTKTTSNYGKEPPKPRRVGGTAQTRPELKSSIPKPVPYSRSIPSVRSRSSSSCQLRPSQGIQTKIPTAHSMDRGKTSASLQYRAGVATRPQSPDKQSRRRSPSSLKAKSPTRPLRPENVRPKSASTVRNPYPNVKAKVNSIPYKRRSASPKRTGSGIEMSLRPSAESCFTTSASIAASDRTPGHEHKSLPETEEVRNKQLLNIYNELKKLQSPQDLQPLEQEICRLMQNKTLGQLESSISLDSSYYLTDESPEFVSIFENKSQELLERWLRLVVDVASAKWNTGNSAFNRLVLPDTKINNIRDEVWKFLGSIPNEGELLRCKLKAIEDEQHRVLALVVRNATALCKNYESLKDKHTRLERTFEDENYSLKEQVAILGSENQKLDRKFEEAVSKYKIERTKNEQNEKYKHSIIRDLQEVRATTKFINGKTAELDAKSKGVEAKFRSIDVAHRSKDQGGEKESKQYKELTQKYNETKESINKLKEEIIELKQAKLDLEAENISLKRDIQAVKSSTENEEQQRNELVEKLSEKTKQLDETEKEKKLLQAYLSNSNNSFKEEHDVSSKILIDDLTKDIHERNLHIQELMRRNKELENFLTDKSNREEVLSRQVKDLQRQPYENETMMKNQIREMEYRVKDLEEEKAELEKIVCQKTLELDQRDLLMVQHAQVLHTRDELMPMVENHQRDDHECIEKLAAFVYEKQRIGFGIFEGEFNGENILDTVRGLEKQCGFDPKMVERELSFRQEKMSELYSLMEHKQMEMMRLERRLRQVQGSQHEKEQLERTKEARISFLQRELNQRKSNKSRGFFSMFGGQGEKTF